MSLFSRKRRYEINEPRLMKICATAREEAIRRRERSVDALHDLLGLLDTDDPVVSAVFQRAGVDRAELRRRVEAELPPPRQDEPTPRERDRTLPSTPDAVRAFTLAFEEADELDHPRLLPEHLLVGLLRQKGKAARLLDRAGLRLDAARAYVFEERPEQDAPGAGDPGPGR
jgi:ATP-dependent Clp protease ATP-binding subunit ClpA